MPRSVRAPAIQLIGGALLIIATLAMPWATHTAVSTDVTTKFRGGPFAVVLVALGVASIALSLLTFARPSMTLQRLQLVFGCAAVVVSVALALSKISAANRFQSLQEGGGQQTSYAIGSGLGILVSAVIALTSAVVLASATVAAPGAADAGFDASSGP